MKTLITNAQHHLSAELAYLLASAEIVFGNNYNTYPQLASISLAHEILKFCLNEHIERIFPTHPQEINALKASEILFEEFGIAIGLSKYTFNKPAIEVKDFNELSSKLLHYGYPQRKLAIGRGDLLGDLILIDDEVKNFEQIWLKIASLSFIQLGKLFNHSHFQPLFIYQIDEGVDRFNFLMEASGLKSIKAVPDELKSAIENFFDSNKIEGFYQVYFSGNNLVRIKNAFA
nr:hypothetical protein [Pseudopedobacter sp.]